MLPLPQGAFSAHCLTPNPPTLYLFAATPPLAPSCLFTCHSLLSAHCAVTPTHPFNSICSDTSTGAFVPGNGGSLEKCRRRWDLADAGGSCCGHAVGMLCALCMLWSRCVGHAARAVVAGEGPWR